MASDLVFDDSNHMYGAHSNNIVYRIDADARVEAFAVFQRPFSLAFEYPSRLLYVGDVSERTIRAVDLSGNSTLFATNVSPHGLTFGSDGALYVSDWSTSPERILRIGLPRLNIRFSEVEISWSSRLSAHYRVDYCSELTSNIWIPLVDCIEGNGAVQRVYDKILEAEPQRFYRLALTNCVVGP